MKRHLPITMVLAAVLAVTGCEALPTGAASADRDFVIPAVDITPKHSGAGAEALANFGTAVLLHSRSDSLLADIRGASLSGRAPGVEERQKLQQEADDLWKDAVEYYRKTLALDPRCVEACERLSAGWFGRGDAEKGTQWLKEADRIDPGDFMRLYRLGAQCERTGRVAEAMQYFAQAERARNDADKLRLVPLIMLKLASLQESQGQFAEAIATYQRFMKLEKQPDSVYEDNPALLELLNNYAPVYRKIGEISVKMGRMKEAADAYRQAYKLMPGSPDSLLKLAEAQRDAGDLQSAVDTCKEYVEKQPNRLDGMTLLLDIYKRMGQLDKAVEAAQQFLKDKPFLYQLHYLLGNLYEEKAQPDKAMEEYGLIVEHGKPFAPAYLKLADLEAKRGRLDRALAVVAKGLAAGLDDEAFYTELDRRIGEGAKVPDLPGRFRLAVEQKDQDFGFYYVLGRLLQEMKKPGEAVVAFKEVLRLKPEFTQCAIRLASVYIADDKAKEAVEVLKAASVREPTSLMVWRFLADAEVAADDVPGAVAAMKQVVFLDPGNTANVLQFLSLMNRAGEGDEADRFLEQNLEKNPDDAERWSYILAVFCMETDRRLDRAVEALKDVLAADPENLLLTETLGRLYLKGREFGLAAETLRAARKLDPDNIEVHIYLAEALEQDKKPAEAEKELRELLRLKPRAASSMAELGRFLVRTKRSPEEGLALLRAAIATEPADVSNRLSLAVAYLRLKRHAESVAVLTEVLAKNPNDAEARYQLGMVYDDMKDFPKAEAELKKVLKADPDDGPAANALGYIYAEHSVNLEEALKLVDVALKQEPENGAYLDSMGWIWFKKGDSQKALAYLQKALEREKDAVIAEHLGDVYYRIGEKDKALQAWEEAVLLDAESKTAPKKIELLKAGKDPLEAK